MRTEVIKCEDGSETSINQQKGYYFLHNSNNEISITKLRDCLVNKEAGSILTLDSFGFPTFYSLDLTKKELGGVFRYTFNHEKEVYEGKGLFFGDTAIFDPKKRELIQEIKPREKGL